MSPDWLPAEAGFRFALGEQDFARADELARLLRYEANLQLVGWRDTTLGLLLNLVALVRRNGLAPTPPRSILPPGSRVFEGLRNNTGVSRTTRRGAVR